MAPTFHYVSADGWRNRAAALRYDRVGIVAEAAVRMQAASTIQGG